MFVHLFSNFITICSLARFGVYVLYVCMKGNLFLSLYSYGLKEKKTNNNINNNNNNRSMCECNCDKQL